MRTVALLVLTAGTAGCVIDPVTFSPATVPALRTPMNDAYLGLPTLDGSRRPTFTWAPSTGADQITYELQLSPDPSFASSVTTVMRDTTTFQPEQDLPVATAPPVGTRYHWRVRACVEGACSPFSRPRWVNVGRSDHDVNGDGYADVVIGAPGIGRTLVYFGHAGAFDQTPDGRLAGAALGDGFGSSVGMAGDVNGDGFADVVVGAPYTDDVTDNAGRAYVYLGGPGAAFDSTPDGVLEGDLVELLGQSVSSAGDVNADGYSDVVVGGELQRVHVYLGGAGATFDGTSDGELTRAQPLGPSHVASGGDVDGDGFADVLVAAEGLGVAGQAVLYRGGPGGTFDGTADQALIGADVSFGASVAGLGDVNGDGFADVAVGAPRAGADQQGSAFVFYGDDGHLRPQPGSTLNGIVPSGGLGAVIASAGDVNADGFDDLLVGLGGLEHKTRIYYGRSGLSFDEVADGEFWLPTVDIFTAAAAGDIDGDGFADVVVGAPYHRALAVAQPPGTAAIFRGGPDSAFEPTADIMLQGVDLDDEFGSSVAAMESTRAHPINQPGRRLPAPECALVPGGLTWKQAPSLSRA